MTKRCNTCGLIMDVSLFARNRTKKDGIRNDCKSCWRDKTTAARYDMTITEYRKKKEKAGFMCEICGIDEFTAGHTMHIDHDHATGKTRGILCRGCNSLLGMANDNILILKKSIEYLNKYKLQETRFAIGEALDNYNPQED